MSPIDSARADTSETADDERRKKKSRVLTTI
jgi:hypothetical protein